MAERQLNLYAMYAFTDEFWKQNDLNRQKIRGEILVEAKAVGEATNCYTIFPARSDAEILIWSAWQLETDDTIADAFQSYAKTAEGWRAFLRPVQVLWGLTMPSMYARGKSEQDMDPFDGARSRYFVAYPFSKTKEWYLMSMDARQGQMNEHIKLGKTFPEIKQLLLYSFGLQDHEFVVAYETNDLPKFSDLVRQLRSTEARRHTALDTPTITGIRMEGI